MCMALFGIFVTAVSFEYILVIWGWTVIFFFITEWAKHRAYRRPMRGDGSL